MINSTTRIIKRDTSNLVSIHNPRTILAIVIIGVIILVGAAGILVEKFWNRSLRDIFTSKKDRRVTGWFVLKKWILIAILFLLNGGFMAIVYFFGNQQALLAIFIILKAKDIICAIILPFYYAYKICTLYNYRRPLLRGDKKTIVAIVPVYNEKLDEIAYTVDSVIYNSTKMYKLLVVIICDGDVPKVDSLMNKKKASKSDLEYHSWRDVDVRCDVIYGYRAGTPLVIIKKGTNMQKKDSLILAYDVFNRLRHDITSSSLNFRKSIIKQIKRSFGISTYHYMFFTDADSFIQAGSLTHLIDEMEYRNVGAACGLVVVDFGERCGGLGNIYQNFQYLYGQYIRRNAENIIARVTCMPGCITMVKVDNRIGAVISDYAKMPSENRLIRSTIQRLGTDRRLTHLFLVHKFKICMVDSAVCYTKPPESWYKFLTQRRRWGSNAFFNTLTNIWSMKIHPLIRISSVLDITRMSLVYFRLFNIALFIYGLTTGIKVVGLVIQLVIVLYPEIYFLLFSCLKRNMRIMLHKILVGFIINKLFTGFVSISVTSTVFYNVGNLSWGGTKKPPKKDGQQINIYTIPIV